MTSMHLRPELFEDEHTEYQFLLSKIHHLFNIEHAHLNERWNKLDSDEFEFLSHSIKNSLNILLGSLEILFPNRNISNKLSIEDFLYMNLDLSSEKINKIIDKQITENNTNITFKDSKIHKVPINEIKKESKTVLVVDDMEENRFILEKQITPLGYEIETANNGFEALSKIQKKHYNYIIMDLDMPGMDGIETTKIIRLIEVDKPGVSSKITALTAYGRDEIKLKCLNFGFNNFITKPASINDLKTFLDY